MANEGTASPQSTDCFRYAAGHPGAPRSREIARAASITAAETADSRPRLRMRAALSTDWITGYCRMLWLSARATSLRIRLPSLNNGSMKSRVASLSLPVALAALLAGCGSSTMHTRPADGIPRLDFGYDSSAPLGYADHGRINKRSYPIAVRDVSFRSGGRRIQGYLLVPPGSGRRPGVVFVHGSGGDRSELLVKAAWLAARNVVTLTITAPSSTPVARPTTIGGLLAQSRAVTQHDVVAVRRAVDLLRTLPTVDPSRIGYLGWSAGARTGTYVAAAEPRIKALVLLSAGADPLAAFVANAPPGTRGQVRRVLGSIDPIRYIAWANPGSVLLEDGRKDAVVPRAALLNIARAAPRGTVLRWYDAPHALNRRAYRDAFDWLARKLPIDGPRVRGAATE
jgi:dienelactone hydrolase